MAPIILLGDSLDGGAGVAARRLARALVDVGLPMQLWHFSPERDRPAPAFEVSLDPRPKRPTGERILKNFSRLLADRLRARRHERALRDRWSRVSPVLLNLHNIHTSGLNHTSIARLAGSVPIVWTMHDCWPFDHEAYSWWNSQKRSREFAVRDGPTQEAARERRHTFFSQARSLVCVAPSRWLLEQARAKLPGHVRLEWIPNGLPVDHFTPMASDLARANLALEPDLVWVGLASTWGNPRKGVDIVVRALDRLDCRGLGLLIWGRCPRFDWPAALTVRLLGPQGEERLPQLYSACDLFLCPSRADNLPNTLLESLACGTPVAGSNVGGIPDAVRPGLTGWLFEPDEPEACASAIIRALSERGRWGGYRETCRRVAESEYADHRQAARYLQLFTELSRATRHQGRSSAASS